MKTFILIVFIVLFSSITEAKEITLFADVKNVEGTKITLFITGCSGCLGNCCGQIGKIIILTANDDKNIERLKIRKIGDCIVVKYEDSNNSIIRQRSVGCGDC